AMYWLKLSGSQYLIGVYPPHDGVCIYYRSGFHGRFLFFVESSEAERLLPDVRRKALRECSFLSSDERRLLGSDAPVDQLVSARLAALAALDSDADQGRYRAQELNEFEVRWGRIRRFWLNILFEGLFLNGWLVLVGLPFFRRSSPWWNKAISAGVAFPFLMVPYFLGYCPWA